MWHPDMTLVGQRMISLWNQGRSKALNSREGKDHRPARSIYAPLERDEGRAADHHADDNHSGHNH
jgi:hypothetical protein